MQLKPIRTCIPRIIYPVGIVKGTDHLEEAKSFFQFLQSKAAKSIFKSTAFK
ncbi:substrate-binding domain-containing protein [Bacillus safensis]|uniref:substrate-binding domain-containing protein n=1 Tax=Bacillus safensis TaxID=561879 RepID=UPI003CF0E16C